MMKGRGNMLAMSDIYIDQFFPVFANAGLPVAFLVPTPTGYDKSIMDAIATVRTLLKETDIHDYYFQEQGPENKARVPSYFVEYNGMVETMASLYRPKTKKGDPRIWFTGLKNYCQPRNLLALTVSRGEIYVFNLSNDLIRNSLFNNGFVADVLQQLSYDQNAIARELLWKIKDIHDQGFLPSITPGDPGVGDTLENALSISRNNSELPDYKGIELKASRLTRTTRRGTRATRDRVNLFSKVPDGGLSYCDIVGEFGRWTWNEAKQEERLSIQNTTFFSKVNSFGLVLNIDNNNEEVHICYEDAREYKHMLSYWYLSTLNKKLLEKHKETFWVKAVSDLRGNREWFRYDIIEHTKNPNTSLILPLIETDKIMIDLAGYYKKINKNGRDTLNWRDHGMLFKMWPQDLPLLFGEPEIYYLDEM